MLAAEPRLPAIGDQFSAALLTDFGNKTHDERFAYLGVLIGKAASWNGEAHRKPRPNQTLDFVKVEISKMLEG
mgnify:CR=1 FL=1